MMFGSAIFRYCNRVVSPMTETRMFKWLVTAAALLGAIGWSLSVVNAQQGTGTGGAASPRPSGRIGRDRTVRPVLQVSKVSPRMEEILLAWSNASKGINKLEGKHHRYVYDKVFEVEKRAVGLFYYESPDKGRIDISPRKIPKQAVSRRLNKIRKPYTLQPDKPIRWISNGKQIMQIDDSQKVVNVYPIPPESRGQNIMNGPLPFLFGMPPEQAKRRYELKLLKETETTVWLHVKPRLRIDAANWKEARVILNKSNRYLPTAVQLIDPSGNRETVYTFSNLKVNKRRGFFPQLGNPFKPKLFRYRVVLKEAKPAVRPAGGQIARPQPTPGPTVPSVIGLKYTAARDVLKRSGYEVKFQRGERTTNKNLVYRVQQQKPRAKTTLPKGQAVLLVLYDTADGKPRVRSKSRQ